MGTLSPSLGSPLSKEAHEILPENLKPHLRSRLTSKIVMGPSGVSILLFCLHCNRKNVGVYPSGAYGSARALVAQEP